MRIIINFLVLFLLCLMEIDREVMMQNFVSDNLQLNKLRE